MKQRYWTEKAVFAKLSQLYPESAYAIIPQAPNGTGYHANRHLDALVVSCWPSRGLWFAGVEIKISSQDFKKEIANPSKAESIQKFCKYWYIAAPENVIALGELPETWGLIEVNGRSAKITKPAPVLKHEPPNIHFVCAVLRASQKGYVPKAVVDDLKESFEVRLEKAVEEKLLVRNPHERVWKDQYDSLKGDVDLFEKESGIKIESWDAGNIGAAVGLLTNYGVTCAEERIINLRNDLDRALNEYRNALKDKEAAK